MAEEVQAKKKKSLIAEFKEFITRGNVVDLAVGVIIGGAFTAIVTALTSGILQPLINWVLSLIFGGSNGLESCRTILGTPVIVDGAVDWSKTIYIDWGVFISAIINFLLVALVLFIVVKVINKAHAAGQKAKAAVEAKIVKKTEDDKEEEKAE